MWNKSKAEPTKSKSKLSSLIAGKAQARLESIGWNRTRDGTDCIKAELVCLTGPNKGRRMWRTFWIEGTDNKYGTADENTVYNMGKFKEEMGKVGVSANVSPDEAMESIEDCILEVQVWYKKFQEGTNKGEDDTSRQPTIYFNKFIKGPEEEPEENPTEAKSTIADHHDKIDAEGDDVEY